MKKFYLYLFSHFFIQLLSSQITTSGFVFSFDLDYPNSSNRVLRCDPANSAGVIGPQTGVFYTWTFKSKLGTWVTKGSFSQVYLPDTAPFQIEICMHARNIVNDTLLVCRTIWYDPDLVMPGAHRVRFILYNDKNKNCNQDSGEFPGRCPIGIASRKYEYSNTSYFRTDTIELSLLRDTYDVEFRHPNAGWQVCEEIQLFCDSLHDGKLQKIPMNVDGEEDDWSLDLSAWTGWSPGFEGELHIHLMNHSLVPWGRSLKVSFPDSVFYTGSNVPPDSVNAKSISWNFLYVPEVDRFVLRVTFRISQYAFTNSDTVTFHGVIGLSDNETDTMDNRMTLNIPLSGSYDPNDKTVMSRQALSPFYPVDYRIRFQNTGNGYARRVVILDTLPVEADLNTFKIIGMSHAMNYRLKDNIAEFRFDDIMLPDSASEPENSQGYVKFSVFLRKPGNQVTQDSVVNRASIYFDYNVPVMTDEAVIYAAINFIGVRSMEEDGSTYRLYPNPARNSIMLIGPQNMETSTIRIYNTQGELLFEQPLHANPLDWRFEIPDSWSSGYYILRIGSGKGLPWLLLR